MDDNVLVMKEDEALTEAFAEELRFQRTFRRFSQEELAHQVGLNRTYIAKLELAKNQPTLSVLYQIATALSCKPPEFLQAILDRRRKILINRPLNTPNQHNPKELS